MGTDFGGHRLVSLFAAMGLPVFLMGTQRIAHRAVTDGAARRQETSSRRATALAAAVTIRSPSGLRVALTMKVAPSIGKAPVHSLRLKLAQRRKMGGASRRECCVALTLQHACPVA